MSRFQANLLLLSAAILWGFGNVAQKLVLEHLDAFSSVGLRCLIGGIVILPLLKYEESETDYRKFWPSALRVAALFSCATLAQQQAYHSASVTNASFLVNTAAVMTPFCAWFILGERQSLKVILAACVTLAGASLMCGTVTKFSQGDLLAIMSAFCYALWMVELGRHMVRFNRPVRTAAAQFLITAAIALPIGMYFGTMTFEATCSALPELIVLGIGSTAIAFGFQTVAQRYTTSSHAAIIVSAEGIFGALGAAIFLNENISLHALVGAILIMCAIVYLSLSADPKSEHGGVTFGVNT